MMWHLQEAWNTNAQMIFLIPELTFTLGIKDVRWLFLKPFLEPNLKPMAILSPTIYKKLKNIFKVDEKFSHASCVPRWSVPGACSQHRSHAQFRWVQWCSVCSSGSRALPLSLQINTRSLSIPGMDDGCIQTWHCDIIHSTSTSLRQVRKHEEKLNTVCACRFQTLHQGCRLAS